MRTPPPIRTWGAPPAEIIIRQTAPINTDAQFEAVAWRGMELIGGWLKPKDAGFSREEIELDAKLCADLREKLVPMLSPFADDLEVPRKQFDFGFTVVAGDETCEQHDHNHAKWHAMSYAAIWEFSPYHQTFRVLKPNDQLDFNVPYLRSGRVAIPGTELFLDLDELFQTQ